MFQVDAKWKGIFISVIRQGWSEKAVGRGNGDATCVLSNKQLTGSLIVKLTNLFIELLKNNRVYKFEFSVECFETVNLSKF